MGITGQKSLPIIPGFLPITILYILAANLTLLTSSTFFSLKTLSLIFNDQKFFTSSDILMYISDYPKRKKHIAFYFDVL